MPRDSTSRLWRGQSPDTELISEIQSLSRPLEDPRDLDPLIEAIGDSRYVLLGEATHGTSEFYTWRAEISRRLITEKGFSFIAVEGDWPDCYSVDRFVKGLGGDSAQKMLHAFSRWPTWMWANREVVDLVNWMSIHNERAPSTRQVGFYGLDVYSLWDSMHAVMDYLQNIDPELARAAQRAYSCFEPYDEDVHEYARATALVPTSCEDDAVRMLAALRSKASELREDGADAYFNAEQNALITKNAELYYRTMVRGGPGSWNVRDNHMVETLERLVKHHGPDSKAIVWEHNTHVGDARFTDMARSGMVNVGQLVRQAHDRDGVFLVGFGTHHGTVIAAREWGAPMEKMKVPDAKEGSYEHAIDRAEVGDSIFIFDRDDEPGYQHLLEPRGHRAIGVVYDPRTEHWGNYVPTILPRRYDAFLYIEETSAVDPLHMAVLVDGEPPETYPSGE
ncbi:MAG TPA: erythromycin esterase family protein [Gemmatimonadaceae bacterium]